MTRGIFSRSPEIPPLVRRITTQEEILFLKPIAVSEPVSKVSDMIFNLLSSAIIHDYHLLIRQPLICTHCIDRPENLRRVAEPGTYLNLQDVVMREKWERISIHQVSTRCYMC